jgi:hypothetical protein
MSLSGCTDNKRAKSFGGTSTITLPNCEKLVTVTWKDLDLWYLTKPMKKGEAPETSTFLEESNLGLFEGKIIFVESCK